MVKHSLVFSEKNITKIMIKQDKKQQPKCIIQSTDYSYSNEMQSLSFFMYGISRVMKLGYRRYNLRKYKDTTYMHLALIAFA